MNGVYHTRLQGGAMNGRPTFYDEGPDAFVPKNLKRGPDARVRECSEPCPARNQGVGACER